MAMFKSSRIMKIISGLQAADALLLVVWDSQKINPRIYLKEWCGMYKGSVSIGTAECVLEEIEMGCLKKPHPVLVTSVMRRNAVETVLV